MNCEARLDAALARIDALNDDWKLVTHLDRDGARHAAIASDKRALADAALGPLDGMLFGIKDNIAVAGLPWTGGLAGWRDRVALKDATVVARLRAAGAVIVGMLNMHEGALGATTDNPVFGRAANPLDPNCTPGGSSGGSAGAVSAHFVDAALGSDTLGSVRLPAAYCGIAGLKPTADALDDEGLAFLSPSLDTIGPLARHAATLGAIHSVIRNDVPNRTTSLPRLTGLRVAVPRQMAEIRVDDAVMTGLERARNVFAQRGAILTDIDLLGWEPGAARRGGLMLIEAEGAVELAELRDRPDTMSDELRALLDFGANLPSAKLVDAMARIKRAGQAARRALCDTDILLLPTTPTMPFRHGVPVPDNQASLTALANYAGLPALSLPVALSSGLPTSVQLIGPDWSDIALTHLASQVEAELASLE